MNPRSLDTSVRSPVAFALTLAAALALGLSLPACGDSGGGGGDSGSDSGSSTGDTCEGLALAVTAGPTVVGGGLHAELSVTDCDGAAVTGLEAVDVVTVTDGEAVVPADLVGLELLDAGAGAWAIAICPDADGVGATLTVTVAVSATEFASIDLAVTGDGLDADLCDTAVALECGSHCDAGVCLDTGCCEPTCGNAQCGEDGCGGVCGTCSAGTSCGPNTLCIPPWTYMPGLHDPRGIAADADHVYFCEHGTGTIMRAPPEGLEAEELAVTAGASSIVLDATHIYWTASVDGAIYRMPKTWEEATPPLPEIVADGQQSPKGLEIDDTHVYWANAAGKSVVRAPKAGGDVEVLAEQLKGPQGVRLDATHVYWTESGGGKVARLAKDDAGGIPETVVSGQGKPWRLWIDETHVYFTNYEPLGTVVRVPKDGGTIEILAQDLNSPRDIVGDDTHVYFTAAGEQTADFKNGATYKHPKDGLTELVANNQPSAGHIIVTDDRIYWGQGGTFKEAFVDGNLLAAWK